MATTVDLNLGLNLEIGSVPVSLNADVQTGGGQTVYTFNGCMQTAEINIGKFISYVGQQFGVSVQLPPELNLEADIDYIAGQVIYTSKGANSTTQVGAAAKFDLIYSNGGTSKKFSFTFYADIILTNPTPATGNPYVIGGAIDTDLKFADLPLVGDIPGFNDYTLKHLGFSYTNAQVQPNSTPVTFNIPKVDASGNPLYTRSDPNAKNATNYSISTSGNQGTFALNQGGFAFTAGLSKNGATEQSFNLPMALPPAAQTNTPASYYQGTGKVNTSPPDSPVHWINVNKTFGPVSLQKIGLNYSSGEATFGLSAGLAMAGVTLDVQGLTITFPLPLPGMPAGKTVSFDIQGLALGFQEGSLMIGGAFLKVVNNNITNYFGEVVVQVGSFGFKAIGGYAPAQNGLPPAFFLYANLEAPLGGPPFLYVTGLAFGFGVNYGLVLPTIDTLPNYLFLPGKAPQQGSAQDALTAVINTLIGGTVIKNEPGEYWVGAGVQFTSFEMISAFAMITFSFGVEMQVALIGSCSIALPENVPYPVAQIEIDLVASFTPSTGLLSVLGVIAPSSYIFGPFVKLSGGFAFNIWFSGEHAGDFVVTLGGYHPSYNKPDWYPAVPRVRITFALGPFQASGSTYIALTPSMFMAGFAFSASFTAGPIKAWFNMGADFLIGWAPFKYEADAYINLGCDINLGLFTLSIHIGADLQIWGPPFGGKADVDLDVVSFTISFGSAAAAPPPVTWQNVETNFLPPPAKASTPKQFMFARSAAKAGLKDSSTVTANVSASVATGLITKDITSQDGEVWDWIVDPDNFMIVTATTIPANYAYWSISATGTSTISIDPTQYNLPDINVTNGPYLELAPGTQTYSKTQVWNPTVNVAPMKLSNIQSIHTITLCKRSGNNPGFTDYITSVAIEPVLGNSNTALWGTPDATSANNPNIQTLLTQTLLGFQLIPLPRNPDTVSNVPLIELLFTAGEQTNFSYTSAQPDTSYQVKTTTDPDAETLQIDISGASTQSFPNQFYVLQTLVQTWVAGQRNAILTDLDNNGFGTYAPSQVTLTAMGTTEALTDWPVINILGTNKTS
jgi:hypothetical protein